MNRALSSVLEKMIRIAFFSSTLALILAAAFRVGCHGPAWVDGPIYESCCVVGLPLIVLWGIAEGLMTFFRSVFLRVWLLALACGAAWVPCFAVLPAAWRGDSIADIQTWHLLPLFAAIHMATATALFGGLSGIVIILIRLSYSKPSKHHNAN